MSPSWYNKVGSWVIIAGVLLLVYSFSVTPIMRSTLELNKGLKMTPEQAEQAIKVLDERDVEYETETVWDGDQPMSRLVISEDQHLEGIAALEETGLMEVPIYFKPAVKFQQTVAYVRSGGLGEYKGPKIE